MCAGVANSGLGWAGWRARMHELIRSKNAVPRLISQNDFLFFCIYKFHYRLTLEYYTIDMGCLKPGASLSVMEFCALQGIC